jgi:hypothetical protein
MNVSEVRRLIRRTIKAMWRFNDNCTCLEIDILGGMPTVGIHPPERRANRHSNGEGFEPLEECVHLMTKILTEAAFDTSPRTINDKDWIDGIIKRIQQAHAGIAINGEDDKSIFIYEPPDEQ